VLRAGGRTIAVLGNGLDRLRLRRFGCIGERTFGTAQDCLEATAAGCVPGARVRADGLDANLGGLGTFPATLECGDLVKDGAVQRGQQLRGRTIPHRIVLHDRDGAVQRTGWK